MSCHRRGLFAALIAVLFVAGCANSPASSAGAPASAAGAPASSAAAPASSAGAPAADKSGSSAVETLSGTVIAGVEANCLLLQGDGRPHLLIFENPALKSAAKVGASVTVVGTSKPAQMTTCQQGVPFIVSSISVN
jgi:hypothetical protein